MIGVFVGGEVGGTLGDGVTVIDTTFALVTGASTTGDAAFTLFPIITDTVTHLQKPVDFQMAGDGEVKRGNLRNFNKFMKNHIFGE